MITVYHPIQHILPDFQWGGAERLRLRARRLIRRIMKVVLIVVLAIAIVLVAVQPVAASAPTGHEYHYIVQLGDTLTTIALRHSVSVRALAAINGLDESAWVYVGQALAIPGAADDVPVAPAASNNAYVTDPRVPDPMPQLSVIPHAQPDSIVPFTYARVVQDNAPVYGHPSDVIQGRPPKRTLGVGYVWVSVQAKTAYDGEDFYQINAGEYVKAEALSFYQPSAFQGVALAAQPERPFAWILTTVQPNLVPGGEVNPEAPAYQRYQLVQIFATEQLGDQVWYLIGPHQWINQIYVGKVAPSAPPEGVGPGEKWIEVNLFEQTLAAYEGDRMVYATLVSSGLPGWNTPTGLNRVWLKVASGKMSGGYNRPDYYFLEDVPWSMYFNKDVALHTAYWHDGFGYKHSHGCVNLAPLDAKWLFEWAPSDAWVWVHAS